MYLLTSGHSDAQQLVILATRSVTRILEYSITNYRTIAQP